MASVPTGAVIIRKGVENMGLRFRKSIKLGNSAKLNINKKSVGLSVGGKGARYTVNSSGRRTKSVGIPGTGLSYVSTSGGRKSSSRSSHGRKASSTSKGGCLLVIIIFCAISVIVVGISRLLGYKRPTTVEWQKNEYSVTMTGYDKDFEIDLKIKGEKRAKDIDPKDVKIVNSNSDVCQITYLKKSTYYITYAVIPLKDGFADVTATYDGVTSDPITITVDMGEKVTTTTTTTTTTTAEPETTTEAIPVITTAHDPAETAVHRLFIGCKRRNRTSHETPGAEENRHTTSTEAVCTATEISHSQCRIPHWHCRAQA